jgi:hypothetical protein
MELALRGHRRLRSNRKLKSHWRRPKLDLEKIVRADRMRKERERREHELWKSGLTSCVIHPYIL